MWNNMDPVATFPGLQSSVDEDGEAASFSHFMTTQLFISFWAVDV